MSEPIDMPRTSSASAAFVVDRCICADRCFGSLLAEARSQSPPMTLVQLRAATGCCIGCGLCEPYVRRMLATGQTAFALAPPDQRIIP